jgi:hypothetical protein
MNFRAPKEFGVRGGAIFWLAEQLLASQEWLYYMEVCTCLFCYFPAWDMMKPLLGAPVYPSPRARRSPIDQLPARSCGLTRDTFRLGAYDWPTKLFVCTAKPGLPKNCSMPSGHLCRRFQCFLWLEWSVSSGYLPVYVIDTSVGTGREGGGKPGNWPPPPWIFGQESKLQKNTSSK